MLFVMRFYVQMTRAASIAGAQGHRHCVSGSFDVYCLGLLATKV